MKPITKLSGLQAPVDSPHTTGDGRRVCIRRLTRHNFPATPRNQQNNRKATSEKPFSLRRTRGYESNGTHTDTSNLLPSILHEHDGRNDKVHIYCKICTVTCDTEEDAQDFIFHLGGPPSNQLEHPEQFSRLLTIAPHQGNGKKLNIRSKPFTCGGRKWQPPLFSGKLWTKRVVCDDGKINIFISADLFLNVNRALNHQRKKLANQSHAAIYANDGPVDKGLCGGDNLAPLSLRPREHDNARSEHIKQAMRALRSDVRRAARISDALGSGRILVTGKPTDYSLREVETCWEVGGVGFDAPQALADITPALYEYGGKRGWEGNAGTVTRVFSKSERLAVYAKTPNRLRFEIRHTPPKGNHPYSSATLAETAAKLDGLRKLAAVRINKVLSLVGSHSTASRDVWEWEAFAMAWGACYGTTEAAKILYGILRQHGCIYGGKSIECIAGGNKLLRRARDAGLISNIHGAFRPVFSNYPKPTLTDFDSSALFSGHNTETQPVASVPNSPTPIRKRRDGIRLPPCPPLKSLAIKGREDESA